MIAAPRLHNLSSEDQYAPLVGPRLIEPVKHPFLSVLAVAGGTVYGCDTAPAGDATSRGRRSMNH